MGVHIDLSLAEAQALMLLLAEADELTPDEERIRSKLRAAWRSEKLEIRVEVPGS